MMNCNQYKAHKDNVIDLFNRYMNIKGEIKDGVDSEHLKKRIESLKNDKFTLAVAGEVKAGKSTFLNALIGAEILPSDVLQASSAIVEIFKSDTSYLKVKFADDHEESLDETSFNADIDKVNKKLQEISKINDEYRHIPTILIDNEIIENNSDLVIDNDLIDKLEQQSGEQLKGKINVIEKYISERTRNKIPVKIELGYPLKWEFNEFRVVDTPGVNATGGVQDVSFKYLEEANAILFVHPIKPVESESFRKFISSVISNRSKDTLFMILTHAGFYSDDEIERLHSEAKRLYSEIIPEERILVVDSLLKLIHGELEKDVPLKKIKEDKKKKKILSSYKEQAEDEDRELIDVVYEASRFQKMFETIDEFSMKAPTIQLLEILDKIREGYAEQDLQYTEKIDRLGKRKKNPQEFEKEIERIIDVLDEYKLLIKETKEDLLSGYSGRHSSWQKDIEAVKTKYSVLIQESHDVESARKNFVDGLNTIQCKVDGFSEELTQTIHKTVEKIGETFSAKYQISTPKVDLDALEEETKKSAYKEEDMYEVVVERPWYFLWFVKIEHKKKVGTKKVFDEDRFINGYKDELNKEFHKIINTLPNQSKETLNKYLDNFEEKIESLINDRQCALIEEKNKQQSNFDIIKEIDAFKEKKSVIKTEMYTCKEVSEDLR